MLKKLEFYFEHLFKNCTQLFFLLFFFWKVFHTNFSPLSLNFFFINCFFSILSITMQIHSVTFICQLNFLNWIHAWSWLCYFESWTYPVKLLHYFFAKIEKWMKVKWKKLRNCYWLIKTLKWWWWQWECWHFILDLVPSRTVRLKWLMRINYAI